MVRSRFRRFCVNIIDSEFIEKDSWQAEQLASCLLKSLHFTAHDIRPKSG